VEIADVVISLPPPADPALFADVPEERAAARRKGMKAVNDAQMQRETRIVSLGNAAFPGEGLAKLYGGDLAQLSRSFWDAVQADPKEIADRGAKVRERLSGNRVVRVTDPRGTDLTVKLGSRRVTVTSGLLASDEALQPGPAFLWLPAGEVYTVPTEFSADGRVRIDVGGYRGQLVRDLTLVFREGKLVSVEGGPASGAALLQKALAASDGAKDVLAVLDLGVNPRSRPVAGSAFRSFEMDGMVTLGIGQNSWAGGSNASDFAWYFQLADATVAVDGVALVENGQLKL
jgi:leucyl aminopeptidase (aminopeptidase T)